MNKLHFTYFDINQSIPARFEQVVSYYADNIALVGNNQRLTYQELNKRVNQVAHAIKAITVSQIDCVAFLVDYSPNMIVTTLAVLKARKIYLAIHPQMPVLAQRQIVEDAQPELMVTTGFLKDRAKSITEGLCPILVLDEIDAAYPENNPEISINPHDLSTIFYTSGTTGQPKGVVKSHCNILHRVWLAVQHDGICSTDRQSLLTYSSFASSESDTFGSLLNGATLYLFDIVSQGLGAFRTWLENEQITVLHPPVLLFRRFLSTLAGENLFPSVRLVLLAGDTVLPSDIGNWKHYFAKSCTLVHRFSTTETGILTVVKIENDQVVTNNEIPAGFPVADKSLFLVDEEGRTVAEGKTGELMVKSPYIAQGYWRKPQKTSQVFRIDPSVPHQRIYRTGDLGQFQRDGSFRHIGRRDHQVKIRGYRVDLREIESVLAQFTEVLELAVIARKDNDEQKIFAFLVLKPGLEFSPRDLRQRLLKILPEWKIPSHFQSIDALPTTANGKIDREKLSARNFEATLENEYVAPRNSTEATLAAIWQEVFKLKQVGIYDNFFELGGHSLLITQLISRIRQNFPVDIPLRTLFELPTVAEFAPFLTACLGLAQQPTDLEYEEGKL